MSRFRADFSTSFADMLFELGEEITFTPLNGEARTITAIIIEKPSVLRSETGHKMEAAGCEVTCFKDDTTGINDPSEGDYITWGGAEWDYSMTRNELGGVYVLQFSKTKITGRGSVRGQM